MAGLWVAFSSAAGAAVIAPLVSTSTSASGTALRVTFNQAPALASSYSLTLTDGSSTATFSSAAGSLSASVSGNTIDYTLNGSGGLSLSSLVEVLGSTGVSDASGNSWDLVASGQVDKAYLIAPPDHIVLTFNEPVTVGANYAFTLTEGSGSAVIDNGNSNVASGNGTSAVTFIVTSKPSGTVAADGPNASKVSGVTPAVVGPGDTLTAVFNSVVLATGPNYSLALTDGADSGTLTSGTNLGTPVATPGPGAGQTTVAYSVNGAPAMTTGTQLLRTGLTATAQAGLTGAATPVAVAVSGATPAPVVTSDSVNIALSTACTNVGVTRVFGGSNCDIGFNRAGPVAPDVYDVIPLPTQDLPGPPNDAAPEVITSCVAGSSDVAYDVNTGAELGANPCGNNPPGEASIGNTNSNTLDYIPTPKLVSFQEVGVVETIPGSTYLSATSVPPQLAAITINGSQATFSYYGNVVCQASNGSSDSPTYSSYTYVTPYTKTALVPGDLVYPTSISCPSGSGSTSLTLTYPGTIPFSSGLRFKFTGFGAGHYIIGAPGSPFANEREASQSAYAGPTATITSFTPQSTTLSSSSGGPVGISFATTGALSCAVGAASLPAGAGAPALPSVASCNGTATISVPANTNTTTNAVYTVTLTALGVPGTPAANAEITITVPAAPPPPVTSTPPTILGTATVVRSSPSGGTKPGKGAPNTRLLYEKINSKRHTATFRFKAIGKSTGFRCALVRRPTRKHAKTPAPKYTKCRSPKTFKHLKAGSYVLRVRALGPGGVDKTPATYRFKIK